MSESRGRYLAKNTIFFTIGNFGSKIISFLLVPLYTNVLSTEEYGNGDLITTLCGVLAPILILNISESVMRFQLDKDANKNDVFRIGIRIFIISIFLGIIIIPLYTLIKPIKSYWLYMYFYNVSIGASTLFLYDLRGKEKLLKYSIGGILMTLSAALLNILFLVVMHLGLRGYILAYIFANVITTIYCVVAGGSLKDYRWGRIDREKMKEMIRFSVVLIPNTFMWWIMNSSDRLMIATMVSSAQAGIYAISYKLPTLVSTLTGIFNQAWGYSAIHEHGSTDESEYNNRVFVALISFAMLMGIGMLTIMKPFLRVYVEQSFYEAWKYTPFLVIGCVYLTMGTFMSTTYNVHKDSMGFLISATIGATTNVALNFLLIPQFEVYGASIATCISYVVVFVFRYFHTRKYIVFNIRNKEFIFGSIFLLTSSALMYVETIFGLILQILILILSCILYSNVWLAICKMVLNRIKAFKR